MAVVAAQAHDFTKLASVVTESSAVMGIMPDDKAPESFEFCFHGNCGTGILRRLQALKKEMRSGNHRNVSRRRQQAPLHALTKRQRHIFKRPG